MITLSTIVDMHFLGKFSISYQCEEKYIYMHSDMQDDQNRTVNGKRPHYQNLKTLFSIYKRFDKLISVSEATMKVNQQNFHLRSPKINLMFVEIQSITQKSNV